MIRALLRFIRALAFTISLLTRQPARWCPHCGEASTMREVEWLWIEARDSEVICSGCIRAPRLWLKAAPR